MRHLSVNTEQYHIFLSFLSSRFSFLRIVQPRTKLKTRMASGPHSDIFHYPGNEYDQFVFSGLNTQGLDSFKQFCGEQGGKLLNQGESPEGIERYSCIIKNARPESSSLVLLWMVGILAILLMMSILGFLVGHQIKAYRAKKSVRAPAQRTDLEDPRNGSTM